MKPFVAKVSFNILFHICRDHETVGLICTIVQAKQVFLQRMLSMSD